jgi:hypothetical protein
MHAHQHPNGRCPYKNNSNSNTIWYIFGVGALGIIGYKIYHYLKD